MIPKNDPKIIVPEFKKSPKELLVETTSQTFEAIVALSYAIDVGMIVAFTVGADDDGKALCEVIFPRKADAAEDDPNPSRQMTGNTPISALASAGEVVRRMIELEHSNSANHNDFISAYIERRSLRKSILVTPQSLQELTDG